MRRIVCTEYRPPDALGVVEEDTPRPSAGEVLIANHAVGVSFIDSLIVQGANPTNPPKHEAPVPTSQRLLRA